MMIIYTIILAVALVVLLRASYYFLKLATHGKSYHVGAKKIFPWIEAGAWVFFIFWAADVHFRGSVIFTFLLASLALLLILLLGWFVLRDIIAGIVLRSVQTPQKGMVLRSDAIEGTIASLGILSLKVRNREGELVSVPYSRLAGQNITRPAERGRGQSQVIKLRVPQRYGAQKIQQILRKRMLSLPWVIAGGELKISLIPHQEHYVVEVSFQTVQEEMLAKTEELLHSFARENFPED